MQKMFVEALLCVLCGIGGFDAVTTETNVDTLEPTLIRSPALSADTEDGFGWAAIFHQIEPVLQSDSMDEALLKTRVIIGAPRGSYPGGLNLPDPGAQAEMRTGLVYSCPILGPGVCEGITGDTSRYIGADLDITNGFQNMASTISTLYVQPISEGRLFDQAPNSDSVGGRFDLRQQVEQKQGQLMGSVLYSNGDTFVACGHLWDVNNFNRPPDSQPRGICFSGDRQLRNFKTELPCIGQGFSTSAVGEGYCGAGFSVTVMADQIHVGAPGFFSFVGAVFSRPLSAAYTSPFTITDSHFISLARDRIRTHVSYHGIQVASGYVSSNDRAQGPTDLLVAASRDNQTLYIGRVYMYNSTTLGSPQTTSVAEGMQMAEFFGHSIALCDLTGDGYDELLVGAPMYTVVTPAEEGGLNQPEKGRLYVFFNTGGSLDPTPVILEGFQVWSRFGYTVTNLGDIDADGHEDLAVSAPYETSSSTQNTGSVYIYYGRDTKQEFSSQIPQRIHGDDIVDSVENLNRFRTFGFSLSGNIDVDNNQYKDVVVGGYMDQAVVVLRSLPIANVTVSFGEILDISVDALEPSVEVTVTAKYEGIQVPGPLDVPFTLSEVLADGESRMFFTRGDLSHTEFEGIFSFSGPNVTTEQTITVYAVSNFAEIRPYRLLLDLNDIPRTLSSVVDGRQPLADLSVSPRIRRQGGENTATIDLINPCGDDGCQSDISLSVTTPSSPLLLLQGQERSISLPLTYANIGTEEARNVQLYISDFPDTVFEDIRLSLDSRGERIFDCSAVNDSVVCMLNQDRFQSSQTKSLTLTLVVNSTGFIGNEEDFFITLNIVVDTSNNNTDTNKTNNEVRVPFSVGSVSNIDVDMSFGSQQYRYTGVAPPSGILSATTLGDLVTLFVTVGNTGPSTIQNARVNISFPSRVSPDSDLFYLYPSIIVSQLPQSMCTTTGIDPNDYNEEKFMVQRQKRSLFVGKRARSSVRTKRQNANAGNLINCLTRVCVNVVCEFQTLTTEGVLFTVQFHIDERFFASSKAGGNNFTIEAVASVAISDEFQVGADNPSDNSDSAVVVLYPAASTDNSQFIHVIIWPTIVAFILIVLFILLLYKLGFFRRKSRGEEEEEKEDITPPAKTDVDKNDLTTAL